MHSCAFRVVGILLVLVLPTLSGCLADPPRPPCDATALVRDGIASLAPFAHPDGGFAPRRGGEPDPRTTAWVLLAAGLARRTGDEGALDPGPHLDRLEAALPHMVLHDGPVDSVANNLSLVRVALQAWGRSADSVFVDRSSNVSLEVAWATHYDEETGRYGTRLNEHLFGAFAAWLFAPPDARLDAMANHTVRVLHDPGPGGDPTERDAWWAAYARAALGTPPADAALAERLERRLELHRTPAGGVRGFSAADAADASTTAAALMAWQRAGHDPGDARVQEAVDWLCAARSSDGTVPFRPHDPILVPKTTAEVVIAVALHLAPVPWGRSD